MSNKFWRAKIISLVEPLNMLERGQKLDQECQEYLNALTKVLGDSASVAEYVETAQCINGASDRAMFNLLPSNDSDDVHRVKHLLSGKPLDLELTQSWSGFQQESQEQREETNTDRECAFL